MTTQDILNGELLDDISLSIEELARACGMDVQWLALRVQANLLASPESLLPSGRFYSQDLIRARRLAQVERTFDINQEAAAMMVDLIEEVQRLRTLLQPEQIVEVLEVDIAHTSR